jgi:hypothetical protein
MRIRIQGTCTWKYVGIIFKQTNFYLICYLIYIIHSKIQKPIFDISITDCNTRIQDFRVKLIQEDHVFMSKKNETSSVWGQQCGYTPATNIYVFL